MRRVFERSGEEQASVGNFMGALATGIRAQGHSNKQTSASYFSLWLIMSQPIITHTYSAFSPLHLREFTREIWLVCASYRERSACSWRRCGMRNVE